MHTEAIRCAGAVAIGAMPDSTLAAQVDVRTLAPAAGIGFALQIELQGAIGRVEDQLFRALQIDVSQHAVGDGW